MTESGFVPKSLSLHSLGTYNYEAITSDSENLNQIFLYCMLNTTLRGHTQGIMRWMTNSASGLDSFIEEGVFEWGLDR